MSPLHIHLAVNHVPLIGLAFSFLLLEWGVYSESLEMRRAALAGLLLSVLGGMAAYLSGLAGEELAEKMLGVPEALIERHEEAGGWALAGLATLGLVSGWGLWRLRWTGLAPRGLWPAAAGLALACLALLGRASWLGGQVRHPELQPDWKQYRGVERIMNQERR